MIIKTSLLKINVEVLPSSEKHSTFVFLLHGFTGSSDDWSEIISLLPKTYSYVAVDLIGHGKSDAPNNIKLYSADSMVKQLEEIFTHFTKNKFILLGYSMGGRAALTYAVHHPEKLSGLILESTSAGISDEKLRVERRQSDEKIIKLIEEKSLEEFIDYWMNQDLFATLKNLSKEKYEQIKNSKVKSLSRIQFGIKSQKIGLINSLKGFGKCVMPPLHDKLQFIKCKSLLITGEFDNKFTQINSELANSFPSAKHVVLKNAGHNVHLEKPKEFAQMVNEFLAVW